MAGHPFGSAEKPLLVAGHGIRLSGAIKELHKVLEKGIPVVTTFNGFDLVPSDHPCFVGRIGTVGTEGGNYALRNCDTLICVGTRNNIRQIGFEWEKFAPKAVRYIVDIDTEEINKPTIKGIGIKADAKAFLTSLLSYNFNVKDWLKECKDYDLSHPVELTPPYKFIHDLTKNLPNDAIVVCGNGTACVAMFQAGIVKEGQRYIWNSGTASMGYDLPAAIGACVASGKKVICVTGDGSIMMNLQELQTIAHYKLPIKIYILDNKGYRSLELTQTNYFGGDFIGCNEASGVSFPDFKKLGEVFGVDIEVVDIGNDYLIQKRAL